MSADTYPTKTLLLGAAGQLGSELVPLLSARSEVVAVTRDRLDLSQPKQLRGLVEDVRPDAIVNAAAYTAVDKAEAEPDLARAVNADAPTALAAYARDAGIPLLHVSTDYVFDGSKGSPYREDDPTGPLGIYGATKLAGERGIRATCDRYGIVRTAWVYGSRGKSNFVKTMLRLGKDREELRVVCDQIGSPTWTGDLARAIAELLPHLNDRDRAGIYHCTNSGVASWYDFAVAIFEEARVLGFPLKIEGVRAIATHEYPTPAKRPAYSVLDGEKLAGLLGDRLPHWRISLRQMLREF
ncbi:dTDP-4-dehydrorhamnose reductase [Rubidibacter lacunae KORDI 51-2]|uniref:dTDP-4-dehydrorhamnose reductase n=1 Tax=Rubidibacter lacunae KORDI 51-2 TaxID=582515 RepID=U5DNX4_9CHRO|nr:dTDP-4-dehydrorhamnose reductase [Rubidibacter lacunae]ERN42557.1 dTDP-4-dehydrorhamnose reductase [Rubidibacter lacunae KORDI 51-2]